MGRDLYSGLWPTLIQREFPTAVTGKLHTKMKHSNTFFQEPNNETPQIFRHLCWDLARAHNLDLGSTIYSVLLSCTSNTFSHCFPFFSSSPNFPCLTGWDDQNLNNQCWHYWVPSLGIMLNPLGGTEPWQLTSCRALSLVVCCSAPKGLQFAQFWSSFT